MQKTSTKFRWDHLQRGRQMQRVGKSCCVFQPIEKSATQTPYRREFMSIRNGDPRLRRCTGGGICGVINNSGGSRNLMIIVMVQLTSTRLVVPRSLLITSTALHARSAIVESSATMHVENYAGSGIKHGSCWMYSSGWHRDLCAHMAFFAGNNGPDCLLVTFQHETASTSWQRECPYIEQEVQLPQRDRAMRCVSSLNSCYVSRARGLIKVSNSRRDLQGHSRALAVMPFDRPRMTSY